MIKSKLVSLLRTFDTKELRAFKDFVASPYFNKQESLINFYQYLKKWASKGFPEERLERKAVFQALYPAQGYDDKAMNHLMSQLLKLAEQFIAYRKMEQNNIALNYYTLSSYVERKLDKPYNHILNRSRTKLEASSTRDDNFYLQQFLLSDLVEQHFSTKKIRQFDESLQEAADHLDVFYLVKKLKYLCAMLDRQKLLHVDYQLKLVEEIETALAQNDYSDIPSIAIYHQLFLTLTAEQSEVHFFQLKGLLEKYDQQFSAQEMQDLYYFSINYCIQKIRVGQKQFAKELMELYQTGIEKEFLLDKGKISPWTYKNMVKLGLGLNRYDWVESFVKDYSLHLPEDKRADAYHFNLADLHYHKKEYDLAMDHLNQVEFNDIHYNLAGKVMLLKIYFENAEEEAFTSLCSSFKIYLIRNKLIPKNVKTPYLNFLRILQEVYKYGSTRKDKIKKKIEQTAMLNDRSWLLQQLT
jgi:hypothetical protein